jgi:exonuclease III
MTQVGRHQALTMVYDAAYEDKKQDFLDELHRCVLESNVPCIVGGDFNLVRTQKDKSNYTWSNNQMNVVMSHIDRIFVSTEFDSHFPIATARALPKVLFVCASAFELLEKLADD